MKSRLDEREMWRGLGLRTLRSRFQSSTRGMFRRGRRRLPSPSGRGTEGKGESPVQECRRDSPSSVGELDSFSLTPTLSRREREASRPCWMQAGRLVYAALFATTVALTNGAEPASPTTPGVTSIQLTCVDPQATGYGTFQSHNQKVVSNRRGIFMTHLRSRNEAYTAQSWRLSWTTNAGESFVTLFAATNATNESITGIISVSWKFKASRSWSRLNRSLRSVRR